MLTRSQLEVASRPSWNKRSVVKFIVLSLELLLLVSVGYSLKRTFEKCEVAQRRPLPYPATYIF